MFECQMVGCSTLVDRQQRTHGHRWLNGELKARQDQQMTPSAGDDEQYWRMQHANLAKLLYPSCYENTLFNRAHFRVPGIDFPGVLKKFRRDAIPCAINESYNSQRILNRDHTSESQSIASIIAEKRSHNWWQAPRTSPHAHCMVLPLGEFNGMISARLS